MPALRRHSITPTPLSPAGSQPVHEGELARALAQEDVAAEAAAYLDRARHDKHQLAGCAPVARGLCKYCDRFWRALDIEADPSWRYRQRHIPIIDETDDWDLIDLDGEGEHFHFRRPEDVVEYGGRYGR